MKTIKFFILISLVAILFSLFAVIALADDYFILNTESGKYHRESCRYLPAASKRARLDVEKIGSYSNISPCQHCNPLDHIGDDREENIDDKEEKKDGRAYWIPIGVFVVLVLLFCLISHREQKIRNEYEDRIKELRKEHSALWERDYNVERKEKENLKIGIVAAAFDCSINEAKEKYSLLRDTHTDAEFFVAKSNKERNDIYNKALSIFKKR